jgi:hypothetical protein
MSCVWPPIDHPNFLNAPPFTAQQRAQASESRSEAMCGESEMGRGGKVVWWVHVWVCGCAGVRACVRVHG